MKISEFRGEYYFLSNFSDSPMSVKDPILGKSVIVKTVEHGFQADKTTDPNDHEMVMFARDAGQAKKAGRKVSLRPDWEDIKIDVMRKWLRLKFSEPGLRQLLLNTGDAELIEENAWGDHEWGICGGRGKNLLGKLLMEVRKEIRGSGLK